MQVGVWELSRWVTCSWESGSGSGNLGTERVSICRWESGNKTVRYGYVQVGVWELSWWADAYG